MDEDILGIECQFSLWSTIENVPVLPVQRIYPNDDSIHQRVEETAEK